jgi:AcrR family transcriptional regulator
MPQFHGGPDQRRGYHHGNLKEAIIEAARRFIAERGLGGFTLVDAARWVGVTPAALYRHFRGRNALLGEVAARGFLLFADRLRRAMQGGGTPIERFTRMGEAYLAFAEEEPGYYTAMFSPRGSEADDYTPLALLTGPKPAEAQAQAFDLLIEALTQAFPQGRDQIDMRLVALEIWALSHGIATLDAAGQLPKGARVPSKYQLLHSGVIAIVHGLQASGRHPTS